MKLPLRIVPNALGELADVKDAEDRNIAFCVDPAEAARLVGFANGRDSLLAALREAAADVAELRRHLRKFAQTTEWHDERPRLMRDPNDPIEERDR
ncbi:hypothetical protein [Paludisphaera soli]|uniref:hypothetical protein n=1 Tax=Paludisphaera soli TaxID=2712865 RepID=UPI0013ECABD7|nr:hypothetical protein [Paludisphaera soli]